MDETRRLDGWIGHDLSDQEGHKIGSITQVYYDDQSGEAEWVAVNTGLFGMRSSFVPLHGLRADGDVLVSPWEKAMVKDAPNVDADEHLSEDQERQLWSYYGLDYDDVSSGRGTDFDRESSYAAAGLDASSARWQGRMGHDRSAEESTGQDTSGPTTDDAMTRSEEELRVQKERRQAGTARLRKWVETEHETETVPTEREQVRVEREPITDANRDKAMRGPEISEEEHEVPLYEEEVVAQTEAVPKERVRLDKSVVTEDQTVEADVRKERIEVEGDVEGDVDAGRR